VVEGGDSGEGGESLSRFSIVFISIVPIYI